MNPKKSGTMFIVLMIALIAFGTASSANMANIGTGLFNSLNISNMDLNSQQQITTIGDPSFEPVYVTKRVVLNVTNSTPVVPTNNTTNSTATNSDD